jgi:hypothetical protein
LRNFALVRVALVRVVASCLAECADLWEGMLMSTRRSRLEEAGEDAGSIGQSGGLAFHACQAFLSRATLGLLRPNRGSSALTLPGEWRPVLDFSVAAKALECGFATLVNPMTAAVPPSGTRPRQREGRPGRAVRIHHRQRGLIKPLPSELMRPAKCALTSTGAIRSPKFLQQSPTCSRFLKRGDGVHGGPLLEVRRARRPGEGGSRRTAWRFATTHRFSVRRCWLLRS